MDRRIGEAFLFVFPHSIAAHVVTANRLLFIRLIVHARAAHVVVAVDAIPGASLADAAHESPDASRGFVARGCRGACSCGGGGLYLLPPDDGCCIWRAVCRGACDLLSRLQRRLQRVACCLYLFAFSVQLSDTAISVLRRAVVRLPEATNLRTQRRWPTMRQVRRCDFFARSLILVYNHTSLM